MVTAPLGAFIGRSRAGGQCSSLFCSSVMIFRLSTIIQMSAHVVIVAAAVLLVG